MTHQRLLTIGETFIGRLRGLCDLYEVLSDGSKSLQDLQSLPWERREQFRLMVLKLDMMRDALHDEEDLMELWPFLSKGHELCRKQVRHFVTDICVIATVGSMKFSSINCDFARFISFLVILTPMQTCP